LCEGISKTFEIPSTLLDFSTLSFESDTYVDKQFRSHFSDLVATVMVKSSTVQDGDSSNQATPVAMDSQYKTIKIYLLAEHKSYDDSKALLQISRYQHQLWEKDSKNNPSGYLTPVISILFHHGKSKLVPVSFHELFDPEFLQVFEEYLPMFNVALINLTALGIEEFPADPTLAMAYWSMKYGRTQLKKVLEQLVSIWQGWEKLEDIDQYRDEVMEYLTTMNDLTMEEFVSIMETTLNEQLIREEFMFRPNTLLARHAKEHYEKGIQKGEQIGIEKGIQKGKQLGIEQGIEIGITKAQQKIIQNLKEKGLTEEEIEEMFRY
jgi:hypothetical protein